MAELTPGGTPDLTPDLTTNEVADLLRLEAVIRRGVAVFVEVGSALMEIRDKRLYRGQFPTFEEYCRDRWQLQRAYAYRLIEAAGVVANLSPMGDILPTNERQARPLTQLEPEAQRAAWAAAVESAPEGKVTAAHVAATVAQMSSIGDKAPVVAPAAPVVEERLPGAFIKPAASDFAVTPAWVTGALLREPTTSRLFLDALTQASVATLRQAYDATPAEEAQRGRLWALLARLRELGYATSFKLPAQPPAPEPWWDEEAEEAEPHPGVPSGTLSIRRGGPEVAPAHNSAPGVAQAVGQVDEELPISLRPGYDSDEWYTPQEYIDAARQVMGGIDLDPASCVDANFVVRAGRWFDKDEDGLAQPWFGRVWLNPPYSAGLVERFVRRAHEMYAAGLVSAAVVLLNNATETQWFQLMLGHYAVCFPAARVRFWRPGHNPVGARQGQAVFYLGVERDRFVEVFERFGPVLQR
jgi:hypothetical protein